MDAGMRETSRTSAPSRFGWFLIAVVAAVLLGGAITATSASAKAASPGVCPEGWGIPFVGIGWDYYARAEIECLYHIGVTMGITDVEFGTSTLTRPQAATLKVRLWEATGRSCPPGTVPYTDIADGHWAADEIACATKLGIMGGVSDTEFGKGTFTRAQAAVIITRLWETIGQACPSGTAPYTDVTDDYWAADEISCLHQLGIVKGIEPGRFAPELNVTRSDAAIMLARLWQLLEEGGHIITSSDDDTPSTTTPEDDDAPPPANPSPACPGGDTPNDVNDLCDLQVKPYKPPVPSANQSNHPQYALMTESAPQRVAQSYTSSSLSGLTRQAGGFSSGVSGASNLIGGFSRSALVSDGLKTQAVGTPGGTNLIGNFSNDTTSYGPIVVSYHTTQVTVIHELPDGSGSTADCVPADVDGNPDNGHQVNLSLGSNVLTVTVYAADGTVTKSYTITIYRQSNDNTLSDLTVTENLTLGDGSDNPVPLSPSFTAGTTSYTANVANDVSQVTVAATANHSGATVAISPTDAATGTDGHQVDLSVGANTVTVTVTPEDGTTSRAYTVTINRAAAGAQPPVNKSGDADLKALTVTHGSDNTNVALTPTFASGTTGYTASVVNSVSRVTVAAVANDTNATISYLDSKNDILDDADPETAGFQRDLSVGSNPINVKVTAEDGATKTYTVTITRAKSDDAGLKSLSISPTPSLKNPNPPDVTLSPTFASGTTSYTASVAYDIGQVTVGAVANHANATIAYLDGKNDILDDADPETGGFQRNLSVGSNTVAVRVTAEDGTTTKTYTVTITRAPKSDDAGLKSLRISPTPSNVNPNPADVTLTPTFASGTTTYTASVAHGIGQVTVAPTANHANATVSISPTDAVPGGSHQVNLSVGANTVTVTVTAEDGATTKTYDVTITRRADSSLKAMKVNEEKNGGKLALSPTFEPGNLSYKTAKVDHSITRATIAAYPLDPAATVSFSITDADSKPEHQVDLSVGWTDVTITVTATDNTTTDYELSIGRLADATLKSLVLKDNASTPNIVPYSPTFSANMTSYTADVANEVSQINVLAAANDDQATLSFSPVGDPQAPGRSIDLAVGANTVTITVTGEDGATTKTYTVTITRAALSPDATLTSLTARGSELEDADGNLQVTITPAFDPNTTSYNAIVTHNPSNSNTTRRIDVTATANHANAKVNGGPSNTLTMAQLYKGGPNTYTFTVTAEDGTTTKTYTLVARRPSTDADLSALSVIRGSNTNVTLSPTFASGTTGYTASVPNSAGQVTVAATANHSGATVSISPADAATGTGGHQVNLSVGSNTVAITVTAENGNTKTYTVTITRAKSSDANLRSLTARGSELEDADGNLPVTITPAFSAGTTSYTALVVHDPNDANTYQRIDVTATANHSGARVNGPSYTFTMAQLYRGGPNTFDFTVTAEDGTATKTYTLAVRAPRTDATLSALSITDSSNNAVTLTPTFASGTTDYTASVANSVSQVTVAATATDSAASVAMPADANSADTGTQVNLSVGSNTVTVTVTAEDGTTTQAYTVTITRKSNDATLSALSITDDSNNAVALSPSFTGGATSYTASVANSVSQVTVAATANHAQASVALPTDNNNTKDGTQVNLSEGSNTVTVTVTAEDGNTRDYTVTISRRADSSLQSLEVTHGKNNTNVTLSPTFASGTTSYTAFVANAVSRITVTGTPTDSAAGVSYSGTDADGDSTNGHQMDLTVGSNTVTVTVTASDNTTTAYTVTITRNQLIQLKSLTATHGSNNTNIAYTPAFSGTTYKYKASVANSVSRITVAGTALDGNDTVSYSPDDVDTGTAGHQADLSVGSNVIRVTVDDDNSNWQANYSLTVTRKADSSLKSLSVKNAADNTAVALSPTFAAGQTSYTATVNNSVSRVTVTGAANDSSAKSVSYSGTDADGDSTNGHQVDLSVGSNTVTVTVTASDDTTTAYTVTITRNKSNDATLSALAITDNGSNAVAFDSNFAADTTSYTASVANSVSQVTVAATANHTKATVSISPTDAVSGGSHQVNLSVGSNTVTVTVTAEDGTTTKTYTVTITRQSNDATLSALTITGNSNNSVTLKPGFDSSKTSYTATVTNSVSQVTVAATANHAQASVALPSDDNNTKDGTQVNLSVGSNTVTVTVTAEDGNTQAYTVTITRIADSSLKSLTVTKAANNGSVTLSPTFSSGTIIYTATVANGVGRVTITGTQNDSGASVSYSGTDVDTNKAGHQVNLSVGANTVTVTVTASDKTTTDYTVTITRKADSSLKTLTVKNAADNSDVALSPTFTGGTTSYTASVTNSVSRVTVTADANETSAGVSYSPSDADTATGHQVNLAVGSNTVTVTVTATDSTTTDYTVTITRDQPIQLKSLTATHGANNTNIAYTPAFSGTTYGYTGTAKLDHSVSRITVAGVAVDSSDTVEYSPNDADTGTTGHQVDLSVGSNTIAVTVKDDQTNLQANYSLQVTRKADSSLKSLTVTDKNGDSVALSPTFAAGTLTYSTAKLDHSINEVTVEPVANDSGATLSYSIADADSNKSGHQVSLTPGWTHLDITVKASDDTTTKYRLGIQRKADSSLTALNVTYGAPSTRADLSPKFASATTSYTTKVPIAVTRVTVTGVPSNRNATVAYSGTDADTGADGHQVDLTSGATTVTVTVTGQDSTTTAYTVVIGRGSSDADLKKMSISIPVPTKNIDFSPGFASGTTSYTASVAYGVTQITVYGTANHGNATVSYSGTDASQVDEHQVDLSVGSNTVTITVTAEDGIATKTYTITVTRAAASTDAKLKTLTVTDNSNTAITLSPTFASGTTSYTADVANGVSQVTVAATLNDSKATLTMPSDDDTTKDGIQVDLSAGSNSVSVQVTAEDGTTTKTYTITITRAAPPSNDATLSSYSVSPAAGTPAFTNGAATVTHYTANKGKNAVVTATANHSGATVSISLTPYTIPDVGGDTVTVTITVTAEDGTTTKTYTITAVTTNDGKGVPPGKQANESSIKESSESNQVSAPLVSPPDAPGSVTAAWEDGSLVVKWDEVSNADGYNVNITTDGKSSWTRVASDVSGTTLTLTDVDPSATVYMAVQATNTVGDSGWTDSSAIQPPGP